MKTAPDQLEHGFCQEKGEGFIHMRLSGQSYFIRCVIEYQQNTLYLFLTTMYILTDLQNKRVLLD